MKAAMIDYGQETKRLEEYQRKIESYRSDLDKLDAKIESLQIAGNKELMRSIRRGLRGKGVSLDRYVKKRGLR